MSTSCAFALELDLGMFVRHFALKEGEQPTSKFVALRLSLCVRVWSKALCFLS